MINFHFKNASLGDIQVGLGRDVLMQVLILPIGPHEADFTIGAPALWFGVANNDIVPLDCDSDGTNRGKREHYRQKYSHRPFCHWIHEGRFRARGNA